jgi:hypothetical protein
MSLFSDPGPERRGGSRLPLLLAGLAVLGVLASGALLLFRGEGPDEVPIADEATDTPAARELPDRGSLRVTADAEGAVVLLDGERLGLAPQTATGLEPGGHRVRVERFGREPFEREIEIRAGREAALHAILAVDPSSAGADRPALRVTADVEGASVFLDREFVGRAPVEIPELGPGPHRLNVSAEGYEMHAQDIQGGGTPREIAVRFRVVRLDQRVAVRHKRMFGSSEGTLSATPDGLRFVSEKAEDSFAVGFEALERFEADYLADNLEVRLRGGRTYNFTSQSGDPDDLFVFHRQVEAARTRLDESSAP